MNGRRPPPRYVPTLTEVVAPAAPADPGAATAPAALAVTQEEIVRRVLQRGHAMLERRLREAIATVVVEQTQALAPLLRDEVEACVRQAVAEAFDEELGRDRPTS